MKAEITVTRTPGEIEHSITLEVSELPDGTIEALPVEDVHLKMKFPKYVGGEIDGYDIIELAIKLADKGVDFELEPDEIEEAKKAIARKEQFDRAEACGLGHLFPLAGLSPHEERLK